MAEYQELDAGGIPISFQFSVFVVEARKSGVYHFFSRQYTLEQQELAEKAKELRAELDKAEDKAMTAELFIATVRKYTRAKKLTERMLNELIERIEVHQAEKVDGVQVQRLTIHYNCVGTIEVPDILPLPQPEIVIQTRKGVAVSYSPSQNAVNF